MSAIKSKGNFLMFRETLTELERLVDIRDIVIRTYHTIKFIGKVSSVCWSSSRDMMLTPANRMLSKELERLAEMRVKIAQQDRVIAHSTELADGQVLDKLINSKIAFVRDNFFSQLGSGGSVEPMTALERLAVVQRKTNLHYIEGLLELKIRKILWKARAKAISPHELVVRR